VDKVLKLFSFQGRANRQRYWLTSLALYGLLLGAAMLVGVPFAGPFVFFAVLVVVAVGGAAVVVRRLHDRGRSGWWALAIYLPIFIVSALSGAASMSSPDAGAGIGLLSLPFSIWIFIDLGCLRGVRGPNRFGPDPLEPLQEVFA
jgi:uncharacterized membrane protein YhaH (DUF805 family)